VFGVTPDVEGLWLLHRLHHSGHCHHHDEGHHHHTTVQAIMKARFTVKQIIATPALPV
jgi:hypothetical protein